MFKTLMMSTAFIVGLAAVAGAQTMTDKTMTHKTMTGPTTTMPRHHAHMMMKKKHVSYGVGSSGRTTATGGNAGGYSSRN